VHSLIHKAGFPITLEKDSLFWWVIFNEIFSCNVFKLFSSESFYIKCIFEDESLFKSLWSLYINNDLIFKNINLNIVYPLYFES